MTDERPKRRAMRLGAGKTVHVESHNGWTTITTNHRYIVIRTADLLDVALLLSAEHEAQS